MAKKMTDKDYIVLLLVEGWTSPMDAWKQLGILTSFRSRMSEIREIYRDDPDFKLEQRDCTATEQNRRGKYSHWREFRLVRKERPVTEHQTSLF